MNHWNEWYSDSEHNRRKVPRPRPSPEDFLQEEDPYGWKRGDHYFIDELEREPQKLYGDFFHILAGPYYTWKDIKDFGELPLEVFLHCSDRISFYGMKFIHCTGQEPISKILTAMKIFPSGAAAKQAGWLKPIPQGYSEMKIAKRLFYFWNPGPPCLYTKEQLEGNFQEPFRLSRSESAFQIADLIPKSILPDKSMHGHPFLARMTGLR